MNLLYIVHAGEERKAGIGILTKGYPADTGIPFFTHEQKENIMEPKVRPAFQLREYYPHEAVRIKDRYEAMLFIKHGAMPIDLYYSKEKNDLVFVFLKSETKELYEKYRRYELE